MMTRTTTRNLLVMVTICVGFGARGALAEPQQMQKMTTITTPTVQYAQATPRGDAASANKPTAANARANLAPGDAVQATSQPAGTEQGTQYLVVQEFAGEVEYSLISADVTGAAGAKWTQVQVGDRLGAGVKIRTMFSSSVKLVLDPSAPPTVMLLEPMSVFAVEELGLQNGISKSRFALGVGAVKAGVAESGDTKSDMEITTPTGTLSKKGTDIFGVEYQNGRFRMWLTSDGRGLIRAIQFKLGSQGNLIGTRSRYVTPGQFVTQEMFKAIDHVKFDREINVNDYFGQTGNELLTLLNNRGFAFLLPLGDNTVNWLGSPSQQPTDGMTSVMGGVTTAGLGRATPRRDGDFGIGQTVLPIRNNSSGFGQKTVRTRQQRCGNDDRQCRPTTRIVKRRM